MLSFRGQRCSGTIDMSHLDAIERLNYIGNYITKSNEDVCFKCEKPLFEQENCQTISKIPHMYKISSANQEGYFNIFPIRQTNSIINRASCVLYH